MTRILMIRHGQSEWNALGKWQGQADPPLSDLGRKQATHVAARLDHDDLRFQHVVTSDLQRAAQTAAVIADVLEVGVRNEPAFRERDVGSWQGLTREEIEERWPGWLAERRRPDDVETDESVLARIRPAIDALADGAGPVLVVCHGGVIFTVERALDAPFEHLANLGGRWLTLTGGGAWELGERVTLVSDDELTVPRQL